MAGFFSKVLPGTLLQGKERAGSDVDEDHNNVEYSIAMEYSGSPLPYDIPRIVPIDVSQIPIAATAASGPLLNGVSFPVIQPICKSNPSNTKVYREPNQLHNGIKNSGFLTYKNGDELETRSIGKMDSSSDCDSPRELSRNLRDIEDCNDNDRENGAAEFSGDLIESERSFSISSGMCAQVDEDDDIEEAPGHARKPSIVTFRDPESNNVFQEGYSTSEAESNASVRPKAVRPGKKGTCYRCLKGNRLVEKEVCIVCSAKYCYNCVLRAMGSMPEGRKCISCIGQRINEANRKNLGKSSRILKQLLPELEIRNIMNSEISCKANQLPPELLYVNRQGLSPQELLTLQTCANPPKDLLPGHYWYDKVSGFWGKEGEKPYQIITPELNVRGQMPRDASKGNTNVVINGREITKQELWMLQVVGVKCEGATNFWVSADGSYQEEGMNNVKGKIWGKKRAKLVCSILSLPTPPVPANSSGKEEINKTLDKLFLVGCEKTGTSTIFKQAKIVYDIPFTESELQSIKYVIQTNLFAYFAILLEGCERFEHECLTEKRSVIGQCSYSEIGSTQIDSETIYSVGPRVKAFSDWLLNVMVSGNLESVLPYAIRKYASFVKDVWEDPAIQATYSRRDELQSLPRFAPYFLERAVEIAKEDYEPSETEILYAEGITSSKGISSMEFSFPKSDQDECELIGYEHQPSHKYQLIRGHQGVLGENCKWLKMFEDIDIVLFCVSLSDYDEFTKDGTNKMIASKQLLEKIVMYPTFEDKKFLLVLNKYDMLEKKISHIPLSRCDWFDNFNPVIGHNPTCSSSRSTNPSLAFRAFQYVAIKFKSVFKNLTDKKLYVSLVTGLDRDNIDEMLRYAREILKWDDEEPIGPNNDMTSTSYSNEESSSS